MKVSAVRMKIRGRTELGNENVPENHDKSFIINPINVVTVN